MLKLMLCECAKLKRKPLFFAAVFLSILIPLICLLLPSEVSTSAHAVDAVMSTLLQLSGFLLLMPVIVVLASNLLFLEQDSNTLKNLMTVPVGKACLATAKLLLLLLFAVAFMAFGGLLCLMILLIQGWEPVGFWRMFWVGLGEGVLMWSGALPCVLLVIALNKSYIVSVIITFFYTMVNYILAMSTTFTSQPFAFNPGTLLPGPLAMRWIFQYFDHTNPSEELAALLEQVSPYFVNELQAFGVAAAESAVFLALIVLIYRRQEV